MPFRYRLVKDINPVQVTPEIEGYPADGFATAKEAEAWAVAHQLDWRWYIHPILEICKACRGTGVVYENHRVLYYYVLTDRGQGMYEPLACDCPLGMQGDET